MRVGNENAKPPRRKPGEGVETFRKQERYIPGLTFGSENTPKKDMMARATIRRNMSV